MPNLEGELNPVIAKQLTSFNQIENGYNALGYGDPNINSFILVCDTISSILTCTRRQQYQALCI